MTSLICSYRSQNSLLKMIIPSAIRLRNIWAYLTFVRLINRYCTATGTYWSCFQEYFEMSSFQLHCPLEVPNTLSVFPIRHILTSQYYIFIIYTHIQHLKRCPDRVITLITEASQFFQKVVSVGWLISPSTTVSQFSRSTKWWLLLQQWLNPDIDPMLWSDWIFRI